VNDDKTQTESLKRQQLAQEAGARDALEEADTAADADKQARRADKARYLREKLEQRERSERQAAQQDDG
jgi:hypothetical protein